MRLPRQSPSQDRHNLEEVRCKRSVFVACPAAGIEVASQCLLALVVELGAPAAAAASPPVNTSLSVISGSAFLGTVLTGTDGSWSSDSPVTVTRNWLRCDAGGQNCLDEEWSGTGYRVSALDLGEQMELEVTASNADGSQSVASAPSNVVVATASTYTPASTPLVLAGFESGDWREWSQLSTNDGSGAIVASPVYEGSRAGQLTVYGGAGNKYARGYFDNISSWPMGSDHWFGGAFYLPPGTISAMQGDVAIMRWDDWALAQYTQDQFGVWLHGVGADKGAPVFDVQQPGHRRARQPGEFEHAAQRGRAGTASRSTTSSEATAMRSASCGSTDSSSAPRAPTTLSAAGYRRALGYGIVAINGSTQTNPLSIDVDNAYTATNRTGCG